MAAKDTTLKLARQLFKLSFDASGSLSSERVTGVLGYVEKTKPANVIDVLKAYQRLIAREVARSQAIVEHAGNVNEAALQSIAAAMSKKYGRPVTTKAKANPALLAGLRVHVGDDVYEATIAGQLSALRAAV